MNEDILTNRIDNLFTTGFRSIKSTAQLEDAESMQLQLHTVYYHISRAQPTNVNTPVTVHRVAQAPLVWLPIGCTKYEKLGGCGSCDGYGLFEEYRTLDGKRRNLPHAIERGLELLAQFVEERFTTSIPVVPLNFGAPDTLNDCLFPPELRVQYYEGLNRLAQDVKARGKNPLILFETRLEQITERKLQELRQYIDPSIVVVIGTGIEASDYVIREVLMNKACGRDALNTLKDTARITRQYNIALEAHSLLGTPGLTELEATVSAAETMKAILEAGVSEAILMSTNIKEADCLATRLYARGLFTPPSVHASVEAVRWVLDNYGPAKMLSFGFAAAIPVLLYGRGCNECTERIIEGLDIFSKINVVEGPEAGAHYFRKNYATTLSCECKSAWVGTLEQESQLPLLAARIPTFVEQVKTVAYNRGC